MVSVKHRIGRRRAFGSGWDKSRPGRCHPFHLGASGPVPGNDIVQLSASGNRTFPDSLNYYTDDQSSYGAGEPGQTFETGTNASGYTLTSLAIRTGGIGDSDGIGTPQQYDLHLYSVSGTNATMLAAYTAAPIAFSDGDWLRWAAISVPMGPSGTYAYSFRLDRFRLRVRTNGRGQRQSVRRW